MRRLGTLVLLAAVAAVLALPARAFAAILPACEVEVATMALPPPEPACEIVTAIDDETGETSVAPICDPRGASAIAPPRILPVSDARIEASPACGTGGAAIGVAPSRNDPPSSSAGAPSGHAIPTSHLALPRPPPAGESFELRASPDGARPGHRDGIERPPR